MPNGIQRNLTGCTITTPLGYQDDRSDSSRHFHLCTSAEQFYGTWRKEYLLSTTMETSLKLLIHLCWSVNNVGTVPGYTSKGVLLLKLVRMTYSWFFSPVLILFKALHSDLQSDKDFRIPGSTKSWTSALWLLTSREAYKVYFICIVRFQHNNIIYGFSFCRRHISFPIKYVHSIHV